VLSGKAVHAIEVVENTLNTLEDVGVGVGTYNTYDITSVPAGSPVSSVASGGADYIYFANEFCTIREDKRGGRWLAEYRGNNAYNYVVHLNAAGEQDFVINYSSQATYHLNYTYRGTIAVSPAGDMLAIGSNSKVVVFSVSYDSTTGVPSLTYLYEINRSGTKVANTDGIAFDVAGNLYVVCATSERFYAYALPKAENRFETPAPRSNTISRINTSHTSDKVAVSNAGYVTYYNSVRAYTLPAGMEGYVFNTTNGLVKVYDPADVVPANTPLVLKASVGNYTLVFTTGGVAPAEENQLHGTDVAALTVVEGVNWYYALSLNSAGQRSSIGFYWMEDGGAAFINGAHKAFLAIPVANNFLAPAILFNENGATNILDVEGNGEEVVKFVKNGQLFIKKNGVVYTATGAVVEK